MQDLNVLYMSAFNTECNPLAVGYAVNGTDAVAKWTSATPAQGELLQKSLDALLQNDVNLASAFPDAWYSNDWENKTNQSAITQFLYSPNGAGQISEPGNDSGSITIYGEVGPLPGHEEDGANSSYCFGSTIPSFPFKGGSNATYWNHGIFGVSDGKPAWFPINPNDLTATGITANSTATSLSGKINDIVKINGSGLFDCLTEALISYGFQI